MSQLKSSFMRDIEAILDDSIFTRDDFEIVYPTLGDRLVTISFIYRPEYRFDVSEVTSNEDIKTHQSMFHQTETRTIKRRKYILLLSPGQFKANDHTELDQLGDLLRYIPEWCLSIRQELQSNIVKNNLVDELRNKFQNGMEQSLGNKNPEDLFTENELDLVNAKFNDLFESINNVKEDLNISKREIEALKKQFEEFKTNAKTYSHGMWIRSTANKLAQLFDKLVNTPEGRQLILEQAKRLLGGGGS